MSRSLNRMESAENFYTPERLAGEVAKNYCGRCPEREGCFSALGDDTSSVLLPMANAVMSRGKVTILDMPPFITSRCSKMNNLASVLNSAGEAYKQRIEAAGGISETKRLMSEQFAGVSLVLDSLARECGERVSFGEELQEAIGNELLRHNIVSGEIVVSGQGASTGVVLTVRACDADKLVLPRIVSAVTGTRLEKLRLLRAAKTASFILRRVQCSRSHTERQKNGGTAKACRGTAKAYCVRPCADGFCVVRRNGQRRTRGGFQ